MPLISIENICDDVSVGLWDITETQDEFLSDYYFADVFKEEILSRYKSESRRKEALAVRCLIDKVCGNDLMLTHNDDGKPFLSDGKNISISHTRGYAALISSRKHDVAIDIEYISDRVTKIKDRFLRHDENAETLVSTLIHWCVKETMYKLYSSDKLGFDDIKIKAIDGDGVNGVVISENLVRNEDVKVYYRISEQFVLTFALV
ncbi:MAG: hypothetical protein Q4D41_04250 [Prevotellaceae bacterium]|nr:hypothetical protein [Prevotellaceae bacterium]